MGRRVLSVDAKSRGAHHTIGRPPVWSRSRWRIQVKKSTTKLVSFDVSTDSRSLSSIEGFQTADGICMARGEGTRHSAILPAMPRSRRVGVGSRIPEERSCCRLFLGGVTKLLGRPGNSSTSTSDDAISTSTGQDKGCASAGRVSRLDTSLSLALYSNFEQSRTPCELYRFAKRRMFSLECR